MDVRRWVAAAAALALLAVPAPTSARTDPVPEGPTTPAWQLRWAPDPRVDGLRAFEFVEEDRANSHPAGQPHIKADGENYRFTMHTVDRDKTTDRQRQEVRGSSKDGQDLILLKGSTWRFTQSMYIPSSLKATTSFTHIMQTKAPGTGTLPMLTMSLQRPGGAPKIQIKLTEGGVTVGSVDLAPLQNRWIDMELEMTLGDAPNGRVRWVLRNGSQTIVDTTRSGVDTWLEDRARPKWGIYRSLGDSSGSLQDCYLLLRNLRAYEWTANPAPTWTRLEAEDAQISGGVVRNDRRDYTGTGFVDYPDGAGYVEFTVNAASAGRAALTFKYANGTTDTDRPLDLVVNGATVASRHPFKYTLSWDEWDTRTISADLRAGVNTIRLTGTNGSNLDNVQVHLTPGATPQPGQRYEAEAGHDHAWRRRVEPRRLLGRRVRQLRQRHRQRRRLDRAGRRGGQRDADDPVCQRHRPEPAHGHRRQRHRRGGRRLVRQYGRVVDVAEPHVHGAACGGRQHDHGDRDHVGRWPQCRLRGNRLIRR